MSHEFVTLLSLVTVHLIWILSPLVPAILIYKLFPTTTVAVSGPLAALTVNSTGAFAGYLIVFAATWPLASRAVEVVGGFQKTYWTVSARIELKDSTIDSGLNESLIDGLIVQTKPEPFYTAENYVHIQIPEAESLPYLIFQVPNFGKRGFDLKDPAQGVAIDKYNRTITVTQPIVISRQMEAAGGDLSTTCRYTAGPKAGKLEQFPRGTPGLRPAHVGEACTDGTGSSGVAVEDASQ